MTTTEPIVYDPYAYEIHENPYPTYARMRDEAPVYRNDERNFWALSRHSDVMAAFRDSERFSNAQGVSIDPAASGPHAHKTMSFLAMDPPATRPHAWPRLTSVHAPAGGGHGA